MKKITDLFACAVAVLLCASCGEMFELDEDNPDKPQMKIDRTAIDIMVGDTYTFNLLQAPEDAKDKVVAWSSANTKVATFSGDELQALATGSTTVTAEWLAEKLKTTCVVNVFPKWELSPGLYPNDMLVYAKVTVNGRPADDQCVVAVFHEDYSDPQAPVSELRGMGMGVTVLCLWLTNFCVGLSFPVLLSSFGLSSTFFIFAALGVFGLLFTFKFVPETKGRSLEQIEKDFRGNKERDEVHTAVIEH